MYSNCRKLYPKTLFRLGIPKSFYRRVSLEDILLVTLIYQFLPKVDESHDSRLLEKSSNVVKYRVIINKSSWASFSIILTVALVIDGLLRDGDGLRRKTLRIQQARLRGLTKDRPLLNVVILS